MSRRVAVASIVLTVISGLGGWFAMANTEPSLTYCTEDYYPVPCPPQNSCPNASGLFCGTPAQAMTCISDPACNCTLNPVVPTSCGLQSDCATGMLNNNVCKKVNNCAGTCND